MNENVECQETVSDAINRSIHISSLLPEEIYSVSFKGREFKFKHSVTVNFEFDEEENVYIAKTPNVEVLGIGCTPEEAKMDFAMTLGGTICMYMDTFKDIGKWIEEVVLTD